MQYVFDLDGVLCVNTTPENFATAQPIQQNIDKLRSCIMQHTVTIHTSRHAQDKEVTEAWLHKHGIPYHELVFGKPKADVYIDDKALTALPYVSPAADLRYELVICVSGGMDSLLAYHYALWEKQLRPDQILCLHFDINQPYAEKEQRALQSFGFEYKTLRIPLVGALQKKPDLENYIIPNRNMIFASIAASLGKRVWILGMKYENHYLMFDKNEPFFRLASLANTQSMGAHTTVESPFMEMSKTDAIRWAISHGLQDELPKSTSCYHPISKRCGKCSLCFKRYIAMRAAGLEEYYDSDPRKSKEAQKLLAAYEKAYMDRNFTHYSKERIEETFEVLGYENMFSRL